MTRSSSYSMSASLSRATMRQKTQAEFIGVPWVVYTRVVDRRPLRSLIEGDRYGHVPEVQAQDSQERQPRQARLRLVSQDVPGEIGSGRQGGRQMNDGAPDH